MKDTWFLAFFDSLQLALARFKDTKTGNERKVETGREHLKPPTGSLSTIILLPFLSTLAGVARCQIARVPSGVDVLYYIAVQPRKTARTRSRGWTWLPFTNVTCRETLERFIPSASQTLRAVLVSALHNRRQIRIRKLLSLKISSFEMDTSVC